MEPAADYASQPDGYPNLNIPAVAAAPQITDAEREELVRELGSARLRASTGPSATQSAEERERLRRLAESHARERLDVIDASE
ncbi:hypothetical protein [Chelativorans sp. Marseille-P2723]|uniref:hypothetical protein n=1 Tax=Chelativorans sp. Marseille-P2723 TaxID=2709133 RepID=UPI00156D9753|nr:hypothetical protein [Chelativorans sp. Marseille-P2723]